MSKLQVARALLRAGKPIVVATHPRSGTHLTIDLLRRHFRPCRSWKFPGEQLQSLYLNLDALLPDHDNRLSVSGALRYLRRVERPIIKTHALPDFSPWSNGLADWRAWIRNGADVIYVVRDGRDVICSYHALMMTLADSAGTCSISQFMHQADPGFVPGPRQQTSRVALWADHVKSWLTMPHLELFQFEQMLSRPDEALQRLAMKLSCRPQGVSPVLPKAFHSLWQSRWARLLGMRPHSTAIVPQGRRLHNARWREDFNEDDKTFFDDQAGDVMEALGYGTFGQKPECDQATEQLIERIRLVRDRQDDLQAPIRLAGRY